MLAYFHLSFFVLIPMVECFQEQRVKFKEYKFAFWTNKNHICKESVELQKKNGQYLGAVHKFSGSKAFCLVLRSIVVAMMRISKNFGSHRNLSWNSSFCGFTIDIFSCFTTDIDQRRSIEFIVRIDGAWFSVASDLVASFAPVNLDQCPLPRETHP